MNENSHQCAKQLIAQERIEGIAASDVAWLAAHLQGCADCADVAQRTAAALQVLRTVRTDVPAGLAERTQFRVGMRAQQLRQDEPRRRALWIAAGASWAGGVASAPYVWRLFAWMGEHAGAPKVLWETGFALWWVVPALVAGVVLLVEYEKQTSEGHWFRRSQ
jgi:hypothetical protein